MRKDEKEMHKKWKVSYGGFCTCGSKFKIQADLTTFFFFLTSPLTTMVEICLPESKWSWAVCLLDSQRASVSTGSFQSPARATVPPRRVQSKVFVKNFSERRLTPQRASLSPQDGESTSPTSDSVHQAVSSVMSTEEVIFFLLLKDIVWCGLLRRGLHCLLQMVCFSGMEWKSLQPGTLLRLVTNVLESNITILCLPPKLGMIGDNTSVPVS